MGGGDLNLKKSWHPNTIKNQERVWKAEQAQSQEDKRLKELRKEIEEEKYRERLVKVGETSGVLSNDNNGKMDWMYRNNSNLINREEYLLGRRVDKTFETLQAEEKESTEVFVPGMKRAANHVEHECIPTSIRVYRDNMTTEQVDLQRKILEDPLMAIKRKEMESRKKLLENPVKLKELHRLLKNDQKTKEKHRKKSKKSRNKGSDDDSASEEGKNLDKELEKRFKKFKHNMSDLNKDITKLLGAKYEFITKELDKSTGVKKRSGKSSKRSRSRSRSRGTEIEYTRHRRSPSNSKRQNKNRFRTNSVSSSSSVERNERKHKHSIKSPKYHNTANKVRDYKKSKEKRRSASSSNDEYEFKQNKMTRGSVSKEKIREKGRTTNKKRLSRSRSRSRTCEGEYRYSKDTARGAFSKMKYSNKDLSNRWSSEESELKPSKIRYQEDHATRGRSKSWGSEEIVFNSNKQIQRLSPIVEKRRDNKITTEQSSSKRSNSRDRRSYADSRQKYDRKERSKSPKSSKYGAKVSTANKFRRSTRSRSRSNAGRRNRSPSNDRRYIKPSRSSMERKREYDEGTSHKSKHLSRSGSRSKTYKKADYHSKSPARHESYSNSSRRRSRSTTPRRQHSSYEQPRKEYKTKTGNSSLNAEEKEARLREMMANASWREETRTRAVQKHREAYAREEENHRSSTFDKEFVDKEMKKAISNQSSITSRIQSNLNNIQRSSLAMNSNFARK
ncbi:pre-mRNA-splicing factor CWC25 homolog isoform X2 [Teleopsis dalmanni]|uniref:pre-mRNA-splicing factor CWC25 homolog isoform X2 n=1 Tax=Teleopsis dalmanni TaxID=139649 RepID=UPI0018CDBC96|nr:pre-mRNA-splicing factor CWC25 homolog isoform X2 [Teleopsis dalmanni]